MSVQNDNQASVSPSEAPNLAHDWRDRSSDFVLVAEGKPPPRFELARERMLISRLYLGLLRTITDDYGAEFAAAQSRVRPFARAKSRTPSSCRGWRC
jgi:hypothetical protein